MATRWIWRDIKKPIQEIKRILAPGETYISAFLLGYSESVLTHSGFSIHIISCSYLKGFSLWSFLQLTTKGALRRMHKWGTMQERITHWGYFISKNKTGHREFMSSFHEISMNFSVSATQKLKTINY